MNCRKIKHLLYQRLLPYSLRIRDGIVYVRTLQQSIDIYGQPREVDLEWRKWHDKEMFYYGPTDCQNVAYVTDFSSIVNNTNTTLPIGYYTK